MPLTTLAEVDGQWVSHFSLFSWTERHLLLWRLPKSSQVLILRNMYEKSCSNFESQVDILNYSKYRGTLRHCADGVVQGTYASKLSRNILIECLKMVHQMCPVYIGQVSFLFVVHLWSLKKYFWLTNCFIKSENCCLCFLCLRQISCPRLVFQEEGMASGKHYQSSQS